MIAINQVNLNASIIRGDSGIITVSNSTRHFETGDTVTLTVKKSLADVIPLISKEVISFNVDGTCTIEIEPNDTKDLDCGTYYYDINWIDENDVTNTLVKDTKTPTFEIKLGATNG